MNILSFSEAPYVVGRKYVGEDAVMLNDAGEEVIWANLAAKFSSYEEAENFIKVHKPPFVSIIPLYRIPQSQGGGNQR